MKKLPYNPQITVNQHFVPRYFLTAWCDNDLLWVANREFRIFQQKPQNVAKSKGIYSLEHMTVDEFITSFSYIADLAKGINLSLRRLIMDGMVSNLLYHEISNGQLTRNDFNRIISFIVEKGLCSETEIGLLKIVWAVHEGGCVSDDIRHFFKKHFLEGSEPFITSVEQVSYPLIENLRSGDLTFLDDPEKRETLFLYIAVQMFRIEKFSDVAAHFGIIDPKTLKLARPILMAYAANTLVRTWGNEEFCVVDNSTDLGFITGDNPICNLDVHDKIKYLDLYFPISPSKAVFVCNKDRVLLYPEMRRMTIQYVHELNRKIASDSTFQVFASKRDTLVFGGYRPSFDSQKRAPQL